ncbi:MAG: hypothetical protein IJK08_04100 [Prevotella sp.]|nr:hypothetical protein [Prevotella sp.]
MAHNNKHPQEEHGDDCHLPPCHGRFDNCRQWLSNGNAGTNGFQDDSMMEGKDTERQHERCHRRSEQHHAVEAMKRVAAEQQAIEQVEYRYQHSYFQVVFQKFQHTELLIVL